MIMRWPSRISTRRRTHQDHPAPRSQTRTVVPGAKGALLRGEGLYDSHISYWRKARNSGGLKSPSAAVPANGVPAAADKGRPGGEAENERLRKRLAKAEVKLEQTRAALDIMGKAFALLEMLSESADSPKPSAR
jgi:transposase-like protein